KLLIHAQIGNGLSGKNILHASDPDTPLAFLTHEAFLSALARMIDPAFFPSNTCRSDSLFNPLTRSNSRSCRDRSTDRSSSRSKGRSDRFLSITSCAVLSGR